MEQLRDLVESFDRVFDLADVQEFFPLGIVGGSLDFVAVVAHAFQNFFNVFQVAEMKHGLCQPDISEVALALLGFATGLAFRRAGDR